MSTEREVALADLQWCKERFGPSREALMANAEYVEAAWYVVELNLSIVHWVLNRNALRDDNPDYHDIASLLTESLFNCCYGWEPSLGKFSTYAFASLKMAFLTHSKEIRQLRLPYRLPKHMQSKKDRDRNRDALERGIKEIQDYYDKGKIDESLPNPWPSSYRYENGLRALEQAERVIQNKQQHTHRFRDEEQFDSGEMREAEALPDTDALPVDEEAMWSSPLRELVADALAALSDREAAVIRLRFGLAGKTPKTLDEIGLVIGVSRERIRQIEAKALRGLRHPRHSTKLRGYLS
jgi:RNA polymerase sigma factor (sigma-70 family)